MVVREFPLVPVVVAWIIENEDGLDMGPNLKYKDLYRKKGRKIKGIKPQGKP
jgi:hypothetical protein